MSFNNRRAARMLLVAVTGFMITASVAQAAISPESIQEMKDEATDLLEVKITKVEYVGKPVGGVKLVYKATILKVDRSKSGRKVGESIKIASYHMLVARPGPKNPPLLKAGWIGTVYLNAPKGEGPYQLAVYGHSFVAKKGE